MGRIHDQKKIFKLNGEARGESSRLRGRVIRYFSQSILFGRACQREEIGEVGNGFELGGQNFFYFLIQQRLLKWQKNMADDGVTLKSVILVGRACSPCSHLWTTHPPLIATIQFLVCFSLSSRFLMFFWFRFVFLSFVYPSHLCSGAYEDSEFNTAIITQEHGHTSRAHTGDLLSHSLPFSFVIFFSFSFSYHIKNNIP